MRLKELFTVPEGVKITDKMFSKVLLSSIGSILLCMACLFGTTWAWFTVTVENTENVIQIATVATDVTVTKDGQVVGSENGKYQLSAGTYDISILLRSDRTESASTVYVVVTVGEGEQAQYYYAAFENGSTSIERQLGIDQDGTAVSFQVSWVKPAAAQAAEDLIGTVAETPVQTEPTAESTTTEAPVSDPVENP